MSNNNNDPVGPLIWLAIFLLACIVVSILSFALVVVIALLFLGWVLTFWLLVAINSKLTDGWITETEGLAALIIPAIFWAILAWWLVPDRWVWQVAGFVGYQIPSPGLVLAVSGGLLGLGWGFLALFLLEDQPDKTKELSSTVGRRLSLPEGQEATADEPEIQSHEPVLDLLKEGVMLGEDY